MMNKSRVLYLLLVLTCIQFMGLNLHDAFGQPLPPSHGGGEDFRPVEEEFVFIGHGPWTNPNNWKGRKVPQAESLARVAAQAVSQNLPIRGNGHVRVESLGRLSINNNLIFSNQGRLELEKGGQATVAGQIMGAANKSAPAVLIKNSLNQVSSLIHYTPDVQARVELEVSSAQGNWHMLSAPVVGQTINMEGEQDVNNNMIYVWHEPLQSWVAQGSLYWNNAHYGREDFISGKGYMILLPAKNNTKKADAYVFEGNLHAGIMEIPIENKGHRDDPYKGFNLVGNPYPSAVDWKASEGWTGREYLEENSTGGHNLWIWNGELGQYGVQNSASLTDYVHNGVSRYIPPMQAFWVRAASTVESAVIKMDDRVRVHAEQQDEKFLRGSDAGMIQLQVYSDCTPYRDEAVIEIGHPVSGGGAPKMFSMYRQAPSLYTIDAQKPYSVAFLETPEAKIEIPIGFEAGVGGEYTLHIQGLAQWGIPAELTDLQTEKTIRGDDEITYVFEASPGDASKRFVLTFEPQIPTSIIEETFPQPTAFLSEGILHVNNPTHESVQVNVYTVGGMHAAAFVVPPFDSYQYPFSDKPGVYILHLLTPTRKKGISVMLL